MSRTFNFYKSNYYSEYQKLYNKDILTLEENNIYCLIGCNGIGKSTALTQMTQDTKNNLSRDCYDLSNELTMNFRGIFGDQKDPKDYECYYLFGDRKTRWGHSEDDFLDFDLCLWGQSTGEQNASILSQVFAGINKVVNLIENKTLFLLIDDLDVGVSIDVLKGINKLFDRLIKFLVEHNVTYYIIITANSYELIKNKKCIDIVNMKEKIFKSYESYANFVERSRKHKDKCLAYQEKQWAKMKGTKEEF